MKILIKIKSNRELDCYEAMALTLTFATFEHHVQLWIASTAFDVLLDVNSRMNGMIKSLDLYDLPPAWIADDVFSGWLTGMVDEGCAKQLDFVPEDIDINKFDEVFTF